MAHAAEAADQARGLPAPPLIQRGRRLDRRGGGCFGLTRVPGRKAWSPGAAPIAHASATTWMTPTPVAWVCPAGWAQSELQPQAMQPIQRRRPSAPCIGAAGRWFGDRRRRRRGPAGALIQHGGVGGKQPAPWVRRCGIFRRGSPMHRSQLRAESAGASQCGGIVPDRSGVDSLFQFGPLQWHLARAASGRLSAGGSRQGRCARH